MRHYTCDQCGKQTTERLMFQTKWLGKTQDFCGPECSRKWHDRFAVESDQAFAQAYPQTDVGQINNSICAACDYYNRCDFHRPDIYYACITAMNKRKGDC